MELFLVWVVTYALINAARRAVVDTIAAVRAPAHTLTPPIPTGARAGVSAPAGARASVPAQARVGRDAAPAAVKPGVVHKTTRKAAAVVRGAGESAKEGWHEGWERGRQKYQQRTGTEPSTGDAPAPAGTPTAPTRAPGAGPRPAPATRPTTAPPSPSPRAGGAPRPVVRMNDHTYCLTPGCPTCRPPRFGWRCDRCGASREGFSTEAEAQADAKHPCSAAEQAPAAGPETPTPAATAPSPATPVGSEDDGPLASVTPLRPQFAEYAKPRPEGDKVSDPNQPTNADIATIVATRVFFEALAQACDSDGQQIELALGNLAEMELDQQTLDGFQSTQEDAQRAAGRCRSTVATLNAIHSAMEEAVNATPDAAKTEFYQPV